ncbi:MAG: TRAFAC clade GTPase domain-containing protein [Planktothrix sp.]
MTFVWKKLLYIPQNLPVLNVTMLGPSGVGKTSLLAAMYDQFDNVSKDLQLLPDEETKLFLDQRLKQLQSLVGDNIRVRGGVESTNEPRPFKFEFGETGTNPSLEINFQDYPGEWLEQSGNMEKVKQFILDSAAVLIPIDTPALMELEGKYHKDFNKPTELNELFKKVYKNLDSPRLVILAPVKCEKYMKNPPELFRKVGEGYQKMLNQFASEKLLPKVAVVITPVQTVGSVIFSRIEIENTQANFYFRKRQQSDPYQPKNTEVPLRFLLRFLLKLHLDKRRNSVLTRIQDFYGKSNNLINAVRRFSDADSDSVKIVQGADLFKVKKV